jgi:WD40 repeat protein
VDTRTEAELATLKGHKGTVFSAAFNADGSRVVTASYDATARIWDSRSGRELAALVGHQGAVLSAAFSPDGARVATGSSDGTVRIWDLKTLASVAIARPGYEVHHIGFSSDGTRLIAAGRTGEVTAWPFFADTRRLIDFAEASIPRCLTREQREHFFLGPEPPRWCVTGAGGIGKWPYGTTRAHETRTINAPP